jgi:hypothetical protein
MTDAQFLVCGGLVLLGTGLFQWDAVALRKLGVLCYWAASGLAIWFLTHQWWAGLVALAVWVIFPVSEVVLVLRKLRVARDRALTQSKPPLEEFPDLRFLTQELEDLGFIKVDDCDVKPSMHEQFYRLFAHASRPVHAAVGFISHQGVGFHFLSLTSEQKDGRLWVTWNYPLTFGLKMPPNLALYRALQCETPEELLEAHDEFLQLNGRSDEDMVENGDGASVRARLEKTMERQLDYNIQQGILAPGQEQEASFRYSWRGTLYVTGQVMRDLVRL